VADDEDEDVDGRRLVLPRVVAMLPAAPSAPAAVDAAEDVKLGRRSPIVAAAGLDEVMPLPLLLLRPLVLPLLLPLAGPWADRTSPNAGGKDGMVMVRVCNQTLEDLDGGEQM